MFIWDQMNVVKETAMPQLNDVDVAHTAAARINEILSPRKLRCSVVVDLIQCEQSIYAYVHKHTHTHTTFYLFRLHKCLFWSVALNCRCLLKCAKSTLLIGQEKNNCFLLFDFVVFQFCLCLYGWFSFCDRIVVNSTVQIYHIWFLLWMSILSRWMFAVWLSLRLRLSLHDFQMKHDKI